MGLNSLVWVAVILACGKLLMSIDNPVCICQHHKSNHKDETTFGLCLPCHFNWAHGRLMTIDNAAHKFKLDNLKYLEALSEQSSRG